MASTEILVVYLNFFMSQCSNPILHIKQPAADYTEQSHLQRRLANSVINSLTSVWSFSRQLNAFHLHLEKQQGWLRRCGRA